MLQTNIPGLRYVSGYLSAEEQGELLTLVDQQPWLTEIKRRVQQYGYRYDYRLKHAGASSYLGSLPVWALTLATRLHQGGLCRSLPDQIIVNEYIPGQGIASHVDCVPCFGDTVISLSLGSTCEMVFTHVGTGDRIPLILEPGSLLVITDEARYTWKHGIPARESDEYAGRVVPRSRRVSLTMRTVTTPVTSNSQGSS